jgi:hypothetical protein
MPRGGRRPGAGRKPLTRLERAVTGNAGHHIRVLPRPAGEQVPVVAAIEGFEPPEDLASEERQVWLALAPHAFGNRTLTKATALSFRLLCRNVVLEQTLAVDPETRGGTNHRGILQRVDAELLRFNLSPCGKAIYEEERPQTSANPLDKFLSRKRG